jgi:hypothetical protein
LNVGICCWLLTRDIVFDDNKQRFPANLFIIVE